MPRVLLGAWQNLREQNEWGQGWVSTKGKTDALAPEKYLHRGCPGSYFPAPASARQEALAGELS